MDGDKKVICLFDVDGTLTKSRLKIENDMYQTLEKLKSKNITIGLVGGSDLKKISEQMNIFNQSDAEKYVIDNYDYVFAENGLIAYENGKSKPDQSILKHLGEESLQEIINFSLEYLSKIKIPKKRGNFIEFRSGMINICPVGRSCTLEERLEFHEYDKEHKIREKFVNELTKQFGDKYQMKFSIGGQISIDAFPIGWDKTYCLQFLKDELDEDKFKFDEIYFFGDRTDQGGNDYEIYIHKSVNGHKVDNPANTIVKLKELFNLN